jgi:hypothetical protein
MNRKEKLEETIRDLLYLQQEGEYWDFKEKWHDNNACLLHDIICMANNLAEKDSYIIIGVEDKTFSIKSIENDTNRKNTQNIVDFLKDKKFAGGIRPTVYIETLSNGLDVIVIASSNNTPYYLTENYCMEKEIIRANYIYTRIQDTNTPKDKSADIDKVSLLWRKKFGLDKTPLEQFLIYIKNKDDWKYCSGYYDKYFYKYNPIFVISEILPQGEIRDQILDGLKDAVKEEGAAYKESNREEWFTAIQISPNLPSWHELNFLYSQIKIYSITTVNIDGGRCHMPAPFFDYAFSGDSRIDGTKENYRYSYFIENSIEYKMINFLSEKFDSYEHAFNTAMKYILVFESDDERKQFNDYIIYDVGLERFKNEFNKQESTAYSRKAKDKQFGDQTDEWLKIDHKSAKTNKYFFNEFKNKGIL